MVLACDGIWYSSYASTFPFDFECYDVFGGCQSLSLLKCNDQWIFNSRHTRLTILCVSSVGGKSFSFHAYKRVHYTNLKVCTLMQIPLVSEITWNCTIFIFHQTNAFSLFCYIFRYRSWGLSMLMPSKPNIVDTECNSENINLLAVSLQCLF